MRIRLPHFCVYFAPLGADAFGRPAYAAPQEIKCRWDDTISETLDANGEKVLASGTVYMLPQLTVGGILFRGRLQDLGSGFPANPREDKRSREILTVNFVSNLKGSQSLDAVKIR